MVRAPRLDSNGVKKGAWSIEEDNLLRSHVNRFGHPNWRMLPLLAGLARLGKSCRLRWMNYLKPGLKRGNFTKQEQEIIIKLHNQVGNRWSTIAAKLPGRTDNEVKNHWHAHINRHNKQRVNIKAIKPHQEQTLSLINYCTINQNPKCDNIDLGDPYYVTHEPYDQICMSHLKTDLSSFLEEEFFDFEEMITWNSNNAEIRGKSWCDQPFEDTFDVVLW